VEEKKKRNGGICLHAHAMTWSACLLVECQDEQWHGQYMVAR
jgi:hypothetical protein